MIGLRELSNLWSGENVKFNHICELRIVTQNRSKPTLVPTPLLAIRFFCSCETNKLFLKNTHKRTSPNDPCSRSPIIVPTLQINVLNKACQSSLSLFNLIDHQQLKIDLKPKG